MSRKTTIILCILGGVCFVLGALLLELLPVIPLVGVIVMFIALMLFATVIGTHVQVAIDECIQREIAYRKKVDEIYKIVTKTEKGGE